MTRATFPMCSQTIHELCWRHDDVYVPDSAATLGSAAPPNFLHARSYLSSRWPFFCEIHNVIRNATHLNPALTYRK